MGAIVTKVARRIRNLLARLIAVGTFGFIRVDPPDPCRDPEVAEKLWELRSQLDYVEWLIRNAIYLWFIVGLVWGAGVVWLKDSGWWLAALFVVGTFAVIRPLGSFFDEALRRHEKMAWDQTFSAERTDDE